MEKEEEFRKLKQGDMTVAQYIARFNSLSRFAKSLVANKKEKCRRFERGLRPDILRLVGPQQIKKYSRLVDYASRYEFWEMRTTEKPQAK